MARPLRIQFPHAVYHVTARGNERKAIVRDDDDRRRFVHTLAQMVEQFNVLLHAWVVMDNHYHLVVETPQANLSSAIRHLNGVYTQAVNRRHRRVGHLFQGRYTAILIEKEAYLVELCRYVVLNPVRAGMVRHPTDWPWSSYRATAGDAPAPPWLTVDWVLGQLGSGRHQAQATYRQFVKEGIKNPARPWTAVKGQIYLGSERFISRVEDRLHQKDDPEIPMSQKRPRRPRLEALLADVAAAYGEEVAAIVKPTRRPGEARQVGIYLARRGAGAPLNAIAKRFGIGYTGVSRRVGAVAKRLGEDERLRRRIEEIINAKVKT